MSEEFIEDVGFDDQAAWSIRGNASVSNSAAQFSAASVYNVDSVDKALAFEAGEQYAITVEITEHISGAPRIDWVGRQTVAAVIGSTVGTFTLYFTPNASGSASFTLTPSIAGFEGSVGSLSVRKVDRDRSVSNRGLIINGTVQRSPVAEGADLVGYRGFSTGAHFLSQPYNSAMDFGLGDFSIMVWLDRMEAWRSVVSRGMTGAVSFIIEGNGVANTMRISTGNTPRVRAMPWFNGVWRHLTFVRQNGIASLYLDAVQTDSWSAPENVSVPEAPLFVGRNTIFGSGFYSGKMALLRISATAPTPDQIAKIYEDEKRLFQPGAKCTLFGSSDAVTALAHDPKTKLLHVGTSHGRSLFDGLVRVEHTETPVATAISAVNGLIVER